MDIENPRLTTFEGLRVHVTLLNDGSEPLQIPGLYDLSGALTFHVYKRDGPRLRSMNGLTHQAMMTTSRVDGRPLLERLDPDMTWERTFDLSSYDYTLPAGEYVLQAEYEYLEEDLLVESNEQNVDVVERPIEALSVSHANPVLDGTAIIFATRTRQKEFFLRQYNHRRPLAAWYSSRLSISEETERALLATPSYTRTDSFDHFFSRWVVWMERGRVNARQHVWGKPGPHPMSADVPAGRQLLDFAYVTATDGLHVFFLDGARLECYRFLSDSLRMVFSHPVDSDVLRLVSVGADEHHIHVATCGGGRLHYERLGHDGTLQERKQLFESELAPHRCWLDAVDRSVRAVFVEAGSRRLIQMAGADIDEHDIATIDYRFTDERMRLGEIDVDQDSKGRFHALMSAGDGNLYYLYDARELKEVASGEDRYHPLVIAGSDVYLGWMEIRKGYRFSQVNRADLSAPVLNFGAIG